MRFRTLGPFALLLAILAFVGSQWQTPTAQVGTQTTSVYDAFAFESLTVSTAVKSFTTATAFPSGTPGARLATCTTETDSIRYRFDSGDPTSSVGHSAAANSTLLVYGANNIRNFKAIRSGSGDVTVRCTYSR